MKESTNEPVNQPANEPVNQSANNIESTYQPLQWRHYGGLSTAEALGLRYSVYWKGKFYYEIVDVQTGTRLRRQAMAIEEYAIHACERYHKRRFELF